MKPSSGLAFPGVDHIRQQVNHALIKTNSALPVTFDFSQISTLDYTAIKGIESLAKDLEKQNLNLILINIDENLEQKLNLKIK